MSVKDSIIKDIQNYLDNPAIPKNLKEWVQHVFDPLKMEKITCLESSYHLEKPIQCLVVLHDADADIMIVSKVTKKQYGMVPLYNKDGIVEWHENATLDNTINNI